HHIHQKTRQMLFWKPIVQRRRQKQSLIQIVGAETLSHVSHYKLVMTYITPYFCCSMRSISDTHLGRRRRLLIFDCIFGREQGHLWEVSGAFMPLKPCLKRLGFSPGPSVPSHRNARA